MCIDESFKGTDQERISAFHCQPGSLLCAMNNCTIRFIERTIRYLMEVLEKSEKKKK